MASINDKFTEATNGSRPVPTTLTALLPSGASPGTATCGALTGWATNTAVHFVIYTVDVNGRKVSGSQTDWKGVVSGSTITGLVLKAGTNNGYAIGAIVEAAPTAAWADDVTEGIMVEHNQNGTHNAITAASLVASGNSTAASHISTGDSQLRSISLETIHSHFIYDFIQTGCVWSGDAYASTLNASMTSGVVYIDGRRVAISAVVARAFTASKDTYIDVGTDGTIDYTEVANNAASPALSASHIRLGIIVSGAGNIAAAGSVNQGETDKVLPIASSIAYAVTDSLGNLICPRDPQRKLLGYRQATSSTNSSGTSATQITGLTCPVIVPTGRKVKVSLTIPRTSQSAGSIRTIQATIWDGTVGSGTQIAQQQESHDSANILYNHFSPRAVVTPATASKTYNGAFSTDTGTESAAGSATAPLLIMVELL